MTQRQPPARRSILWVGPGREVPARLLHDLTQRGLAYSIARSAPALIVELSLTRLDDRLCPIDGVVLVDPDRLPRAGELVAVLKDYFPQLQRLRYEPTPDGRGELAALNGRFDPAGNPGNPSEASPNPQPRSSKREPTDDESDEPLISQDELSFLLGTDEESMPSSPSMHNPSQGGAR